MSDNWYEIVSVDQVISQGDILIGCPIIIPEYPTNYPDLLKGNVAEAKAKVYFDDVVILTQACLLAGPAGPKVEMVTVAPIADVEGDGWGFVSDVSKGLRPAYHLLNKSSDPSFDMNYQIVDFANIYSIPYNLLDSYRLNSGPRLRLKSPYVEELSQRFGMFYSKVGLPNNTIDMEELKHISKK
ncbi:hypothetical protein [Paenibacillus vini]|uniref:Uncharacterized protein n=1 Tax=Paenibacillus vini TaxID=1476024 RepID=A0ABQ4M771_9BACL|nr:hypothetical protein [Paenibacillus vini]GIP51838.1 hypothetical protein J42TS3_08730 [Paenibacillus vini]